MNWSWTWTCHEVMMEALLLYLEIKIYAQTWKLIQGFCGLGQDVRTLY